MDMMDQKTYTTAEDQVSDMDKVEDIILFPVLLFL